MSKAIKIGSIIEDTSAGLFAKVISVYHGVYGLSGWSPRKSAEKATVATIHLNGRSLRRSEVIRVLSNASGKVAPAKPAAEPKEPATAPEAPKSTIAKPAVKKAAKRAQAAQKPAKKSTRKSK